METKYVKSNVSIIILFQIFLIQFIVFIGISLLENQKRTTLQRQLEIKREQIRNISMLCVRENIDLSLKRADMLEQISQLTTYIKKDNRLSRRQTSNEVQNIVHTETSILEQTCTNETKICLQGEKGSPGISGQKGNTGFKGDPGEQGLKGVRGDIGNKGSEGQTGLKGQTGTIGSKGNMGGGGVSGIKGLFGNKGENGDIGLAGISGPKGEVGYEGSKGIQGQTGIPGNKGPTGLTGTKGDIGTKGETGEIGLQGPLPSVNNTCECIRTGPQFNDKNNSSITIPLGGSGVVDCSGVGSPGMHITMSKSGTCQSFNSSETYIIKSAKFSDAGTYTCKVLDNGQSQFKTVKVFVSGKKLCTFENGLCDLEQDKNHKIDWTPNAGNTASPSTGPSVDHTYGNSSGQYIYLEASNRQPGDNSILVSPLLSSSAYCLSFAYHMYGKSMGDLKVYVKYCDNPTLNSIWQTSGDKGQAWQTACIRTTDQPQDHQLLIEAVRGEGFYSDIAIDDVEISAVENNKNCSCFQLEYDDFCDFEQDFCHWQQSTSDSFDWIRNSGPTGSSQTGPNSDHTSGKGWYVYAQSANHNLMSADLMSEYLRPGDYCLTYFYDMYGSSMGNLTVYREASAQNGITTKYTTHTQIGNQGLAWQKQQFDIHSGSTFRIIFSAAIEHGLTSDIALDDIHVKSGKCS